MRVIGFSLLLVLASCGGIGRGRVDRPVDPSIGLCADPSHAGRMSQRPIERRADRDINGDGESERIVADENLCRANGNCYWNVFAQASVDGTLCWRYIGTVEGRALSELRSRGEDGFFDLRGYWELSGDRFLVAEYRYQAGAYAVGDTLTCKQTGGDALECGSDRP